MATIPISWNIFLLPNFSCVWSDHVPMNGWAMAPNTWTVKMMLPVVFGGSSSTLVKNVTLYGNHTAQLMTLRKCALANATFAYHRIVVSLLQIYSMSCPHSCTYQHSYPSTSTVQSVPDYKLHANTRLHAHIMHVIWLHANDHMRCLRAHLAALPWMADGITC